VMARLALAWCLCRVLIGESAGAAGVRSYAADCDTTPTGIETQDYRLYFVVPPGLMPDAQFDGRPAGLVRCTASDPCTPSCARTYRAHPRS
jgi:hypothetical protein